MMLIDDTFLIYGSINMKKKTNMKVIIIYGNQLMFNSYTFLKLYNSNKTTMFPFKIKKNHHHNFFWLLFVKVVWT